MIEFVTSDIFATDAMALTNTVNCVGAMGKGIAKGVKDRWPAVYDAYRIDCGVGLSCDGGRDRTIGPLRDGRCAPCCAPGLSCGIHRVRPGEVIVRPTGIDRGAQQLVVDLPTKRHWFGDSRLDDVRAGLVALAEAVRSHGITSIALPPPGCGNGGLSWSVVGPIVVDLLRDLPARVVIHAPPVG